MMKKLLFLLFSLAVLLQAAPKVQYSPDDFRRISAMLAQVLDKNHYSDVRMSDELSCRIFDNFIDDLDPERIFFTEADLKPFALERQLTGYRLQQGEYRLAFTIYDLFRKRYAEYRAFSKKFLSGKIDGDLTLGRTDYSDKILLREALAASGAPSFGNASCFFLSVFHFRSSRP